MTLTDMLARSSARLRLARAQRQIGPCNTAGYVADLYAEPVVDLRDPVVPFERIDEVFRG